MAQNNLIIKGLIKRLNSQDYYKKDLAIDKYLFNFFMTEEEKQLCRRKLNDSNLDIISKGYLFNDFIYYTCVSFFVNTRLRLDYKYLDYCQKYKLQTV